MAALRPVAVDRHRQRPLLQEQAPQAGEGLQVAPPVAPQVEHPVRRPGRVQLLQLRREGRLSRARELPQGDVPHLQPAGAGGAAGGAGPAPGAGPGTLSRRPSTGRGSSRARSTVTSTGAGAPGRSRRRRTARPRLTAHQLHQPAGGQTGRVRPVHRQHGVPGPDSRLLRRPPFRHLHHQRPGRAGLEGGRIGDAGPHAPVALRPVQRPHLPLVARGQGGVAVPQAARHGPVGRPRQGPGVGPRALRQAPEAGPEVGPGRPSIGGERPGGIGPGDLAGRFEGPRPARAQERRRLQGGGVAPQEQPQLGLHGAQGALDGRGLGLRRGLRRRHRLRGRGPPAGPAGRAATPGPGAGPPATGGASSRSVSPPNTTG